MVERAVLQDVDFDPGEEPEGGQLLVNLRHHAELAAQVIGVEAMGHGQPGAVVGERLVPRPKVTAVWAISSIGLPPSDQSNGCGSRPGGPRATLGGRCGRLGSTALASNAVR